MKKVLKGILIILLSLILLFVLLCFIVDDDDYEENATYQESAGQENNIDTHMDRYGESREGTATVLIYIIGSDLESDNQAATFNIQQMCDAKLSDNVNVIIQTGGASSWNIPGIPSDRIGRFRIVDGALELIETQPLKSMANESTLAEFLTWGTQNYPADTSWVIMWNHGGGTLAGYGYDELYPDDSISIDGLYRAFSEAAAHFDVVGFDACLMGTIETAYALYPYADYLIASEEAEPGSGWYYTNWLTELSIQPTGNMTRVGKTLIDDYIEGPYSSFWEKTTLAMIDLSKIPMIYEKLNMYYDGETANLCNGGYCDVSYGRSHATYFGDGNYDQIDIISYLSYMESDDAKELSRAIKESIVYFNTTIEGANGLAMYFPYDDAGSYEAIYETYYEECYDSDFCDEFFSDFLSIMIDGQYDEDEDYYGDSCPIESMSGCCRSKKDNSQTKGDLSQTSWYKADLLNTGNNGFLVTEDGELAITEKNGEFILNLSEEQWKNISDISMSVMKEDEDGFLDLGIDSYYELDKNDNLKIDYDYNWVALNEQIVPFYQEKYVEKEDGSWYSYGYVPATLTRKSDHEEIEIDILIYWDDEHENGYVPGYRHYIEGENKMYQRSLLQFEKGDKLEFICDFYGKDGEYDDSYYVGDPIIIDDEVEVSYELLEDCTTWVYFIIEDIYQNVYYTETVEFCS